MEKAAKKSRSLISYSITKIDSVTVFWYYQLFDYVLNFPAYFFSGQNKIRFRFITNNADSRLCARCATDDKYLLVFVEQN